MAGVVVSGILKISAALGFLLATVKGGRVEQVAEHPHAAKMGANI